MSQSLAVTVVDPPVDKSAINANRTSGFVSHDVVNNLPDGYWLESFPFRTTETVTKPTPELHDLIGYGLGFASNASSIMLYNNPRNPGQNFVPPTGWGKTEIQKMDFPVSMTYADLTGDGFNDVIICDRYGPSMNDLWDAKTNNGGRVQWLRNPGSRTATSHWEAKPIGNSTGMHRLRAGHFTRTDVFQICAVPIIPKSSDLTDPAPFLIFTPEYGVNKSDGPVRWHEENAFPTQFRLIHEVTVLPATKPGELDTLLVAGREGVVYCWHSGHHWRHNVVGTGLPEEKGNPYWGTGSVAVGKVGDDPVGYIASSEAFHGNTIGVYIKKHGAVKGYESLKDKSLWTRYELKPSYGPLNTAHTGTIHNVVCGDFDKSGMDSFVIACMGDPVDEPKNKGMYLYKPMSLPDATFARTKISNESAGRIALGEFNGLGFLDAAAISYYVPNYLTGPDPPSIRILSPSVQKAISPDPSLTTITATRLVNEALIRVPRPTDIVDKKELSMGMLQVAGKRMHIVVLAPNVHTIFGVRDCIKVIYGSVNMKHGHQTVTRRIAAAKHAKETTGILSGDGSFTSGEEGAVVIRWEYITSANHGPFQHMSQLPPINTFPLSTPEGVRDLAFPFNQVDTLAWGQGTDGKPGLWDDYAFYNSTGFHVFFSDDAMQKLCHIQLWTLGLGETARFHNHSSTDQTFCEIHMCIHNGKGQGGMRYFTEAKDTPQQTVIDNELKLPYVEKESKLIELPDMYEHGPLWRIQDGFEAKPVRRANGTVDYPWHAWLASEFGQHPIPANMAPAYQRFDVWAAFEFPPEWLQY